MTKLVNSLLSSIPDIKVNYADFWRWYDDKASEFDKLRRYVDNKEIDDEETPEHLSRMAKELFLGFQAFYFSLRASNVEIITLRKAFSNSRSLIWKIMKSLNDEEGMRNLTDLPVIKDKRHENELIAVLGELNDKYLELKRNEVDLQRKEYEDEIARISEIVFSHEKRPQSIYIDAVANPVFIGLSYRFPTVNNFFNKFEFFQAIKMRIVKTLIRVSDSL